MVFKKGDNQRKEGMKRATGETKLPKKGLPFQDLGTIIVAQSFQLLSVTSNSREFSYRQTKQAPLGLPLPCDGTSNACLNELYT
jgi:hypothetical protein